MRREKEGERDGGKGEGGISCACEREGDGARLGLLKDPLRVKDGGREGLVKE